VKRSEFGLHTSSSRVRLNALTYKGGYHPKAQTYKRKDARRKNEELKEELRSADIDNLKRLMKPLIEKPSKPKTTPTREKSHRT